jgi:hypothetical protein
MTLSREAAVLLARHKGLLANVTKKYSHRPEFKNPGRHYVTDSTVDLIRDRAR